MKLKLDPTPVFLQLLAHRERSRWRVLEVGAVRRKPGVVATVGEKLHLWKADHSGESQSHQGRRFPSAA